MLELMVVAAIFVLLLALAVPAFSNMLYSTEQSMAENSLRGGITAARDAAARGARGDDAVAAFFYDPATGYSIVPYMRAGLLYDTPPTGGSRSEPLIREVFVPVPGYEAVQMPRGWMIRGYAPPYSMERGWYDDDVGSAGYNSAYSDASVRERGNWVFPETAFYLQQNNPSSPTAGDAGRKRQTFIMRFEGGTGMAKPVTGESVLLIAPAPTGTFRNAAPFNIDAFRADREESGLRLARRILTAPTLDLNRRSQLLGDQSPDTVLAKPVTKVALYNERALANFLGTRVDRGTRSMYLRYDRPEFVPQGQTGAAFLQQLNEWIENRSNDGDSDARIFTVHRYVGTVQEVSGAVRPAGGRP